MTYGLPSSPLLVYVGRLGTEKRLEDLKPILDALPGTRLALVGDGPARADLEEVFKDSPVVFLGMTKGEDLSKAYASADIFVMPSESETLGFVVIEAMSSGIPVVAVKAGGIPDLINNKRTGFLYESRNLDMATRLVQNLVSNPKLRQEVGERARKEVENWGWKGATEHLRSQQYG